MDDETGEHNLALRNRAALSDGGKTVELIGRLYTDFTDQEKYLINNVPFNVRLQNSDDDFRLMWVKSNDTAKPQSFKVEFTDVSLIVPYIKLHPFLIVEHAKMLAKNPAVYPINRTEIKTFVISASLGEWCGQNCFNERIPKTMVVALLDSQAHSGNHKKNPFNFIHCKTTDVSFEINNKVINRPMRLDFPNEHYNDGYVSVFETFHHKTGVSPDIALKDYNRGYTFFCFDMQNSKEEGILTPMQKGNSRLNIKFKEHFKTSVTVLVLGIFDAVVYIDEARNVVFREG